jgi:hypothetical protein
MNGVTVLTILGSQSQIHCYLKKHLNSFILGYILFIKAQKSLPFSQEQPSPGGCSKCEASAARRQSAVLPASEESLQLLPAQQPARL